jgi:hypothetical protein
MISLVKETLADMFGSQGAQSYGLLAEFKTPRDLYHACEKIRDAGYSRWDAHAPFPIHGLERAMGLATSPLPFIVFGGAMIGAASAFYLQVWIAGTASRLVISGKPFFSWPAFIPITFEVGVLFGSLSALIGMLAINELPRLHHSLFNSARFERASNDRFYVSIEARDPMFDAETTRAFLQGLHAEAVEMVER